ncbi:MAG: hypothetical protein K2W95_23190 [Candidatus Obscuribacterales bacterium]|nr:hypothetical protein [Candidatus Obscuribacterales bacterium]
MYDINESISEEANESNQCEFSNAVPDLLEDFQSTNFCAQSIAGLPKLEFSLNGGEESHEGDDTAEHFCAADNQIPRTYAEIQAALTAGTTFDAQGNLTPTALEAIMDYVSHGTDGGALAFLGLSSAQARASNVAQILNSTRRPATVEALNGTYTSPSLPQYSVSFTPGGAQTDNSATGHPAPSSLSVFLGTGSPLGGPRRVGALTRR